MTFRPAPLRCLLLSALSLAAAGLLRAEGSPPMITDDPGTPGDGHWEINVGLSTEKRPGERRSELPLIDLNYGLGDRVQLKFEVPYLHQHETGVGSESALGNSAAGVKWRFVDNGDKGPAVSVYPQFEFNTPGSSADERGLVDHGSAFKLPFQFEQEVGPVDLVAQAGREFRSGGDTWFYGVSVGHAFGEKVQLAVELAGEATAGLHRSVLVVNTGLAVDLTQRSSLLLSLGRELHNHDEPKASLVAFVGVQWRL